MHDMKNRRNPQQISRRNSFNYNKNSYSAFEIHDRGLYFHANTHGPAKLAHWVDVKSFMFENV